MINVASKAWLILFLNFAFWYEIFMSASPQPGKKNLTFDFFFSINKDKRYMPTGTLYSYWTSMKNPKGEEAQAHLFSKNPRVTRNMFF